MTWLFLRTELAVEANCLGQAGDEFPPVGWVPPSAERHYRARAALRDWQREYELRKDRRALAREHAADDRPPCPNCGNPVERTSAKGPLATYCSKRCSKAARQKRWAEKQKNRKARPAARRSKAA